MDTIPIFQTSLIICTILSGAIVMQESKLYTVGEFFLMVIFGSISVIGIWIIIKKPPPKAVKDEEDNRSCDRQECKCIEKQVNLPEQMKEFKLKAQ